MLQKKEENIEDTRAYQFRANEIPKTTTEPLFEKIMAANE